MSLHDSAGGTAFPLVFDDEQAKTRTISIGMSLRDYFAASALNGICSVNILAMCMNQEETQFQLVNATVLAYRLADAMLAERAK